MINYFKHIKIIFSHSIFLSVQIFFIKFTAQILTTMGKEKTVKKEAKKAPAKSLKEKREAKKLKKLAKGG